MPPFPLFVPAVPKRPNRRHQVVPQTSCQLSEGCFTDSWHLNPTVSSSLYFRCFLGLITNELGWPERWTGFHAHTLGKVCVAFFRLGTNPSAMFGQPVGIRLFTLWLIHSSPPTWHSRAPQLTNSHLGPGDIDKKSCSAAAKEPALESRLSG